MQAQRNMNVCTMYVMTFKMCVLPYDIEKEWDVVNIVHSVFMYV